jgi:hypothetical protein
MFDKFLFSSQSRSLRLKEFFTPKWMEANALYIKSLLKIYSILLSLAFIFDVFVDGVIGEFVFHLLLLPILYGIFDLMVWSFKESKVRNYFKVVILVCIAFLVMASNPVWAIIASVLVVLFASISEVMEGVSVVDLKERFMSKLTIAVIFPFYALEFAKSHVPSKELDERKDVVHGDDDFS